MATIHRIQVRQSLLNFRLDFGNIIYYIFYLFIYEKSSTKWLQAKSANWIRNFGIRIGSEGRGVWALIWKQVGLSAGLADLLGEAGPVSQAPVDRHCFAGPGNRCLVQTSIND